MKNYIICILLFSGCYKELPYSDSMSNPNYPIETTVCSHPDGRGKALLDITVEDVYSWKNISFEITQGEGFWSTTLNKTEENKWNAKMMPIGLTCSEDFNQQFLYTE